MPPCDNSEASCHFTHVDREDSIWSPICKPIARVLHGILSERGHSGYAGKPTGPATLTRGVSGVRGNGR